MKQKSNKNANFRCAHCRFVVDDVRDKAGTSHRNHCPHCGWSVHVDSTKGDRAATCKSLMKPVGLMFKSHQELCLVHVCQGCGKVNYNRIAADDAADMILGVFNESIGTHGDSRSNFAVEDISLLGANDASEIKTQLFGRQS